MFSTVLLYDVTLKIIIGSYKYYNLLFYPLMIFMLRQNIIKHLRMYIALIK
jgi:hypothetical protein